MKFGSHLHAIKIDFSINMPNGIKISRSTWVYVIEGDKLTLIDTGVSGCWPTIRDYIQSIGRHPREIETCILSHSHPDHIGGAITVQKETGCKFWAHPASKLWIEDPEKQFRIRPVPSFHSLVEGGIKIDNFINDDQIISPEGCEAFRILHTPGHENGHLAFLFEKSNVLISVDALMPVGDMPTYDDFQATVKSTQRLMEFPCVETILSSFDGAIQGREKTVTAMAERLAWLKKIDEAVTSNKSITENKRLESTVKILGLPPMCCNPVVQLAFSSHKY